MIKLSIGQKQPILIKILKKQEAEYEDKIKTLTETLEEERKATETVQKEKEDIEKEINDDDPQKELTRVMKHPAFNKLVKTVKSLMAEKQKLETDNDALQAKIDKLEVYGTLDGQDGFKATSKLNKSNGKNIITDLYRNCSSLQNKRRE